MDDESISKTKCELETDKAYVSQETKCLEQSGSFDITTGEFDIEDDIDEEISDNKLTGYDIAVFYNTYNLSTLLKWWGNKLIVPDFQRSYVWTYRKASEFVDSVLRGLPVPSMFFYDDTENNRLLVVDGQQRLYSLYCFIHKKEFNGSKFRLTGNCHPSWKGKTFDELNDEEKDRLEDSLLNITVMRQLAPDDGQSSMYLAFQRINTGGSTLTAQEIRMAVSYGPLAKLLDELSRISDFNKWKFLRTKTQRDNGNYSSIQELILKFWTYYFSYPNFSGSSTRSMLDDFFSEEKNFDKPKNKNPNITYHSEEEFTTVFYAAFDVLIQLDEEIFAPYKKPTQTFMEAIWVGLTYRKLKLKKEINVETLPDYIKKWKISVEEKKNGRFSELFQSRRTSSTTSAKERIEEGIRYFSEDF